MRFQLLDTANLVGMAEVSRQRLNLLSSLRQMAFHSSFWRRVCSIRLLQSKLERTVKSRDSFFLLFFHTCACLSSNGWTYFPLIFYKPVQVQLGMIVCSIVQVMTPNGESIGDITKQFSGLIRELYTTADNFGVKFPIDLSVNMKAILLGAVFLIVSLRELFISPLKDLICFIKSLCRSDIIKLLTVSHLVNETSLLTSERLQWLVIGSILSRNLSNLFSWYFIIFQSFGRVAKIFDEFFERNIENWADFGNFRSF